MRVNEFSRRLGIPASKVRYYDRAGLYRSGRENNNYRDFTDNDALDAYLAQSLRSIDLSMEESLTAVQGHDAGQMNVWLSGRISELEGQIAQAQAKLARLKRLQRYTNLHTTHAGEAGIVLDGGMEEVFYSIRTFGPCARVDEETLSLAAQMGKQMPYTYVALTIPEESLLGQEERLSVGLGLGIMEKNLAQCGIAPSPVMDRFPSGPHLVLLLERENVFALTRGDLRPLFTEAQARGLRIYGNAVGRVSLVRTEGKKRYYEFSICCQTAPV